MIFINEIHHTLWLYIERHVALSTLLWETHTQQPAFATQWRVDHPSNTPLSIFVFVNELLINIAPLMI